MFAAPAGLPDVSCKMNNDDNSTWIRIPTRILCISDLFRQVRLADHRARILIQDEPLNENDMTQPPVEDDKEYAEISSKS